MKPLWIRKLERIMHRTCDPDFEGFEPVPIEPGYTYLTMIPSRFLPLFDTARELLRQADQEEALLDSRGQAHPRFQSIMERVEQLTYQADTVRALALATVIDYFKLWNYVTPDGAAFDVQCDNHLVVQTHAGRMPIPERERLHLELMTWRDNHPMVPSKHGARRRRHNDGLCRNQSHISALRLLTRAEQELIPLVPDHYLTAGYDGPKASPLKLHCRLSRPLKGWYKLFRFLEQPDRINVNSQIFLQYARIQDDAEDFEGARDYACFLADVLLDIFLCCAYQELDNWSYYGRLQFLKHRRVAIGDPRDVHELMIHAE